MKNKSLKLKYKSMAHFFEDMDYLVKLGFAEYIPDPETGEYGWRFKEQGVKALENYQEVDKTSIS